VSIEEKVARVREAHGRRARDARGWWVPGRIEVLGKHTDYVGGRSLLCAVEQGFAVSALPRTDSRLRVIDVGTGESTDAEISPALAPRAGHWSNYPLTVARRLARDFPGAQRGVDLAVASDLPIAAGLSSSSAFVVATYLALADANALAERPDHRAVIGTQEQLAEYLGAVENGLTYRMLAEDHGVGTSGGSEDHTAILLGERDAVIQSSCAPVRVERVVPLPADAVFVIAASGVLAEKTGATMAHYNAVAARAKAVLELWRSVSPTEESPTLAALLASSDDAYERLDRVLGEIAHPRHPAESLRRRLRQFRDESMEIIPAAAEALARGDLAHFGALVDRSQAGAEWGLENQIPETIALARDARELGAIAASAFGAGFGGSVYALVREGDAVAFREAWQSRYLARFPQHAATARFFVTRAGTRAMGIEQQS